jgi:predicted TPR repeat methyltransferase
MNNFEIAKEFFLEGCALLEAENYSQAEYKFKQSLEIMPDRASTLTNLSATQLKLKKYSEAKAAADKAILIESENSQAYLNLGLIEKEFKRFESSANFFDKALSLKPDYAEAWSNKGSILHELKRYEEAIAHYDRALSLKPDYAEAWSNKGNTLHELKRYDEAIIHHDKALSFKPNLAEGWSNKGITLHELKRYDEAIAHYDRALSLKPFEADFFYKKGMTNIALNEYAIAVQNFEDAVKYGHSPEGIADYMLSALKPENGQKPMPKNYVSELFDKYAGSFDKHLIDTLKYDAPKKLIGLLKLSINSRFEILDIGCGTGLMGKLLKPYASKIVGVDLSKEMLARAKLTGVYDKLISEEILEFLNKCNDKFDLVVSSDVFIYIGELSNIFMTLSRIVKTGGFFCFSLEKNESNEFTLSPKTLRYGHSKRYIQKLASTFSP